MQRPSNLTRASEGALPLGVFKMHCFSNIPDTTRLAAMPASALSGRLQSKKITALLYIPLVSCKIYGALNVSLSCSLWKDVCCCKAVVLDSVSRHILQLPPSETLNVESAHGLNHPLRCYVCNVLLH